MPTEIVNSALLAYRETLVFLNKIIDDIPKSERQKAWQNWYDFWNSLAADVLKSASNTPK